MRVSTLAAVAASAALTPPIHAQSGALELPEYTAEQRWARAANGVLTYQAALIELGRAHGMAPEQVGEWFGDWVTAAWVGGMDAEQFVVAMHRNHMSLPGASAAILESGPEVVKVRFNRPLEEFIGSDGQHLGVETPAFRAFRRGTDRAVSEWVGVHLENASEEHHDVLTLTTEYGPIRASDRTSWGRASYLSWGFSLHTLALQLEAGLSARDVGRRYAELFGSGWSGVRTPWQLYRAMAWNTLALDPFAHCETLSVAPDTVRARCRIHEAGRVAQFSNYFGDVTLEDVLETNRAFSERIAERLGMRWEETWDDADRTIRVTRR